MGIRTSCWIFIGHNHPANIVAEPLKSNEHPQNTSKKRTASGDLSQPVTKRVIGTKHDLTARSSVVEDSTIDSITHGNSCPSRSKLSIRNALAVALRHLRFERRSRWLWVDNICIDQENTSERNHLVRHMGQIYRLAQKVIVWIGPQYDNSSLAMSKLEHLGRQVELTDKGSWRVNAPGCLQPTWSRTAVELPYDDEIWSCIKNLLERPWFKRLWVWQEAKLSNDDSIIQCGKRRMELYHFGAAAWCAAAKANSIPPGLDAILFRAGDAVLRQFDEPFLNTLLHLNRKECFDSRDKIYGALGLAPPQVADGIVLDYTKDVEDVYMDAAVALNHATGRVDFLLACDLANRTIPGPTWAPDWSVTQRLSPRWVLSTTLASGISISTAEVDFAPRPTLLVQGVEWGTISLVGQRAPDWNGPPSELEPVIKSWISSCAKTESYVTGKESKFDAFVKTILWNTLRERCPLASDLLTLAEAKVAIEHVMSAPRHREDTSVHNEEGDKSYKLRYREALGRSYFELNNGYIGMTSVAAEVNDAVCVVLGCPLPMILRPHSSGRYQVVGPAYIHGLMDAESILGPLPDDYIVQLGTAHGWHGGSLFRNLKTQVVAEDDPRLGELPPSWVRTTAIRTSSDPLHFVRYRDLSTGRTINGDPRLLPEALRARGVALKPLKLV